MSASTFRFRRRDQVLAEDGAGHRAWRTREHTVDLPAAETAILICDMWDHHWCQGASDRVQAMVGPMNDTVQAARGKGALIIHAPSDTIGFYEKSPARVRVREVPPASTPPGKPMDESPLPIDDSDGGCDTHRNAAGVDVRVWTRQHPGIVVDETRDVISVSGVEIYSYLVRHGIAHLVIMGVHTNMCILNRSFAIKQMVRWGVDVMLCRDLTDAMYNPAMRPYVDHDTGTRLVIEYIEKFWCPTVASGDLR